MSKPQIYLAGPISGQTGASVAARLAEKSAILTDFGYSILTPAVQNLHPNEEVQSSGYTHHPELTDHAIFTRDVWMVTQADVVLVDLSGASRVSIGSVMEMAIASFLRKHVVLVMTRESIHEHAFVREAADIIFEDLEAAYDYLKELAASRTFKL